MEREYASKGVAGTGLGLGAGALGVALLNGGLGNILNGNGTVNGHVCSENTPVTRYELGQSERIAELETQVKLRDANTYTLQQISATKEFLEGKIDANYKELKHNIDSNYKEQSAINLQQATWNATTTANVKCLAQQVADNASAIDAITKTAVPQSVICDFGCPCGTTI